MKYKFQSFFDISTSASSMQVLQFSVGGQDTFKRCAHLFGAYKYFKLGGLSIKLVPASTLPVDPLQLSYASDDVQAVDPRDQLNPGLVRITNGEDIYTKVSSLSETAQVQMYQSMMLDPRWSKFMLQSGFRRFASPLYWQIGQFHQDAYPGLTTNVPEFSTAGNMQSDSVVTHSLIDTIDSSGTIAKMNTGSYSSPTGLFQTGRRGRLGFLPTDMYQEIAMRISSSGTTGFRNVFGSSAVPDVSVVTVILPKAYKTIYYYRLFVTETVYFKGIKSSPAPYYVGDSFSTAYLGVDTFALGTPTAIAPGNAITMRTNLNNDGGGQ